MLDAVRYNLSHLAEFTGRDARPTFWFYVLFLVLLNFFLGILVSIPVMAGSMGTAFDAAQAGMSEEALEAQIMAGMGSTMRLTIYASLAITILMTALFVASFVRRVHDTGHSGWWAAIPVATQIASLVINLQVSIAMMEAMDSARTADDLRVVEEMAVWGPASLLPWIGYIVVIVFGVMKSEAGPNRYGEVPVRL